MLVLHTTLRVLSHTYWVELGKVCLLHIVEVKQEKNTSVRVGFRGKDQATHQKEQNKKSKFQKFENKMFVIHIF